MIGYSQLMIFKDIYLITLNCLKVVLILAFTDMTAQNVALDQIVNPVT